jgi:adenosylhomocysteine nucleosidase
MRILMVASDRMEFPGILARAEETGKAPVSVRWARFAKVCGNEMLLAANGVGASRAAAAVDRALQMFPAEAIVSTGFCGAVRPELGVADLVVATSVTSGGRKYETWPLAGRDGTGIHRGVVSTVDHVVQTAEEKSLLAAEGATAVEMEAAGVAERASAHGLPFWCVKAVTDLGTETLMNDYNRALREDGYFDTIILLRGTLRQPFARIRELLRLRERCVRAAGKLGEFFADLRF